jgi:hypothetical protein
MDWLTDIWNSYWSRAALLVAVAAGITLLAGSIAWISRAFRLDQDDVRNTEAPKTVVAKDTLAKESWALESQEPDDFGVK